MNKLTAVTLPARLASEKWAEAPAVQGVPIAWQAGTPFSTLAAAVVAGLSLKDRLLLITKCHKAPCMKEAWQVR
eukprot:3321347-Pyramimonas_sp.AAC.1